jgi:hypothetical protein
MNSSTILMNGDLYLRVLHEREINVLSQWVYTEIRPMLLVLIWSMYRVFTNAVPYIEVTYQRYL